MKGSELLDQAAKLEATGDIHTAADIYRQIVKKYPYSVTAKSAKQRLSHLSPEIQKNTENSNSENAKQSPEAHDVAQLLTGLVGILMASALIWFFGIEVVVKGIGGLILLAVIATVIGAVIVAVILFVIGKPIISIVPVLALGLMTAGIIMVAAISLFVLYGVLTGAFKTKEDDKAD